VIGAGVSGLIAARMLSQQGARVAIVEARERTGGRIWTRHEVLPDSSAVIPVELGAEFVHGLPEESWSLLREAGLATYELDGEHLQFADGQLGIFRRTAAAFSVLQQMQQWLELQSPGFDVSFGQYLDLAQIPLSQRKSALRYVEGFNAADSDRISVASLVRQQQAEDAVEGDRIFHVRPGYASLPEFVARSFEQAGGSILLGHIVRQVQWRPGDATAVGETVAGQEFRIRAARVVITVPLGVLQAQSVRFAPEPAKVLAIARTLAMGPVIRATFVFRDAFWRSLAGSLSPSVAAAMDQLSFLFADEETPRTWWTAMPDTSPIITAWIGGPKALAALGSHDRWLNQCLSTLAKVTHLPRSYLQQLLLSWHCHDWQSDEFAKGAYSYVPAGALEASLQLTSPVEGTLYFAGEHTDVSSNWGTVHGALRSGIRAAQQILAAN